MIAMLSGCGENSISKGFEDGFKDEFKSSFTPSCISGATEGGMAEAEAAAICRCTVEELAKTKSVSELAVLSPEAVTPVMVECAKKAGLPV
jgi:hypothetical protein